MDYKKIAKNLLVGCSENCANCDYSEHTEFNCTINKVAADAILELLIENKILNKKNSDFQTRAESAEARAEKAEKIASDLCDDFTDFVTSGIHNAAQYCANRRPECVDGRGWCNVDMKTCLGFYPEAAKRRN